MEEDNAGAEPRLGDADHLVGPFWLNLEFGLGPVFTFWQSICFHPNLDRPVQLDLDSLVPLPGNVSPRAHIDTVQDNVKSTNRSSTWMLAYTNSLCHRSSSSL